MHRRSEYFIPMPMMARGSLNSLSKEQNVFSLERAKSTPYKPCVITEEDEHFYFGYWLEDLSDRIARIKRFPKGSCRLITNEERYLFLLRPDGNNHPRKAHFLRNLFSELS